MAYQADAQKPLGVPVARFCPRLGAISERAVSRGIAGASAAMLRRGIRTFRRTTQTYRIKQQKKNDEHNLT